MYQEQTRFLGHASGTAPALWCGFTTQHAGVRGHLGPSLGAAERYGTLWVLSGRRCLNEQLLDSRHWPSFPATRRGHWVGRATPRAVLPRQMPASPNAAISVDPKYVDHTELH